MDRDRVDGRLDAEDGRPPASRSDVVEQYSDRGGLARAVGTEEAEYFAGPHLESHLDDPAVLAVILGQTLGLNDRVHGRPIPLQSRRRRSDRAKFGAIKCA